MHSKKYIVRFETNFEKKFKRYIKSTTRNNQKKIDGYTHTAPLVKIGDVWWASLGENIGSEISGKSEIYSRPVIIFKKLSHTLYLVIPTSTKIKEGSWYIQYLFGGRAVSACLHQVRVIDYKRVLGKMGELDETDFSKVKSAFERLFT